MTETVEARKKRIAARSDDPKVLRKRARVRQERMLEEVNSDIEKMYGKPVSEWDFQELQAGQPRNEYGEIVPRMGPVPAWITPAIMAEAQKRLKLMTRDRMGHYAGAAIGVMAKLMKSSRSDLVKFQAAKYILDQIVGMPTQRVEVDGEVNVATFMAEFIVELDGRQHQVIEGAVDESPGNIFDEDSEDDEDE
jgi:hypothetical protein